VRKRWYAAVRAHVSAATDGAVVRRSIMACWSARDGGWIHIAADDEDNGWQVPATMMRSLSGGRPVTSLSEVHQGTQVEFTGEGAGQETRRAPGNGLFSQFHRILSRSRFVCF
jgi:hypothetical protein